MDGFDPNAGIIVIATTNRTDIGRDLVESRNYSDEIAYEIDTEVRRIIDECYGRGRQALTEHQPTLERIAPKALLERESLGGDELDPLIAASPPCVPPATAAA